MMDSAWISRAIGSVCIILISSLTPVKNLYAEANMEEVCFKSDPVGLCHCTGPLLADLPPKPDFTPDYQSPIIYKCPLDITEYSDSPTKVTWTPPIATDNSGVVTLTSDYNHGDSFPIGITTVTYTATDPSGNSATCSFNVAVVLVGSKGGNETWIIATYSACGVLGIAGIACLVWWCRRRPFDDCDGKSKGKTTEAQTDGHNDTCADLEQVAASPTGAGQVDKVNDPGKGIDSPDDDKGKDNNVTCDGGDHVDGGEHRTPEKTTSL